MASTMDFPSRLDPVSNVTGFTYRTGSTYQEILMRLSAYMQTTLPEEFNASMGKLFTDMSDNVEGWEGKFNAFMDNVDAELKVLSDSAVGDLIGTPSSDIAKALFALYGDTLSTGDGKRYEIIAGVLRNTGEASGYWQPLNTDSTHRPINIDSVVTDSGKIRINYGSLDANMTITLVAVPDETLGRAGFTMGASVTPDHADIKMSRVMPPVADYVSYNGTTWVSDRGEYNNIWFSNGKMHLEHKPIAGDMQYAVSITPRGGEYLYSMSPDASPTGTTYIEIGIRDHAGNYVTTPNTNMRFYLTHGAGKVVGLDPTTIDNVTYPMGNIWIFGIMGLPS